MSGKFHSIALAALLIIIVAPVSSGEVALPAVASSQLDRELKGQVLIEELNCAACHASEGLSSRSKKSPRLADIGSRVNPNYIEAFIRDPHGTKPGTTMPYLLASLGAEERKNDAIALTHFLLSLKQNEFSPQPPDAVAADAGQHLFNSRGCAACHSPRDGKGAELLAKTSVPLGALDKKYCFKSLVDFLSQPHVSRPSLRMPDMRLPPREIERIAHYLLRDVRVPGNLEFTLYRGEVWEGLQSENVKPERAGHVKDFDLKSLGGVQHQTAIKYEGWLNIARPGRYTFFLQMNGGSLELDGKQIIVQQPADGREVRQLEGSTELAAGRRKIRLIYYHTGYTPSFSCEMSGPQFERQSIPSSMLSVSDQPVPAFDPLKVDPDLAARGKQLFASFGCANCHDDLQISGKSGMVFAKLDPGRGCLSEAVGAWPRFDLSAEQRGWIAGAMSRAEVPQLTDKQRIDKTLVTFNCIACHERAGLGGVAPERNAVFTGTHEALGDQGRLPPPLTYVGAKLTPEWMRDVLLRGGRQREYVDACMPQFGESNVGHLVDLFGKVDELEAAEIPKVASIIDSKNAGREMMGTTGLSCIACHDYNGQKSAGAGALDIVYSTERLKKNWFHLYLRQPSRFHPTVIMPSYWPGNVAIRPNILGGDCGQQIEALWLYLEDGGRGRQPIGLSRQASELRVGDVAEVTRGHGPAGYRGLAVGYPERLNLAFDTEEMALRELWKGEFANVEIGGFSPRGTDRISLPRGIPFDRPKSLEDNWPYKGKTNYTFPEDHGYQFRGYHLDDKHLPVLLYHYGNISVEDFFEDLRDKDGKAYFRRTFTFETTAEAAPFYFRAAVGKKLARKSDREFLIDQLSLRLVGDRKGIIREGIGDLLIPMTLPKGRSTLTLEYQW